jgi:hypothetical protein
MLEKYAPVARDMRRFIDSQATFPKESIYRGEPK